MIILICILAGISVGAGILTLIMAIVTTTVK